MNTRPAHHLANAAATLLVVASCLSLAPVSGECQDIHFVNANGSTEPVEAKCFDSDKCDAKWLTSAYSPYSGKKLRVAIARSDAAVMGTEVPVSGVEDMLIQALLQTNRFVVVERADDPSKVDFIIGVSVSGAGSEHRDVGGAAGRVIGSGLGLGGLGINRNKTKVDVAFRLIDPKTEEIVAAQTVEGSSTASSVSLGALGLGGGGGAAGGTGGWKSPSLAAAAHVCANKIAYMITQLTSRSS